MLDENLIDYEQIHGYARLLGKECNIPPCDWEDIGSDAYLVAYRRSLHTAGGTENDAAVAARLMYMSVIDVIRRRNTRTARMLSQAVPISPTGTPDEDDEDSAADDSVEASDKSLSAKKTYATCDAEDWEYPFWLRLFDNERKQLRREKKTALLKIINAGLKDSRLRVVRDKLGFSGRMWATNFSEIKSRFALCFQALRAFRGLD